MKAQGPSRIVEIWTSSQRTVVFVLVAAIVDLIILLSLNRPLELSDPQPTTGALAGAVADRIDPNTAEARVLAALPSLGEKRANAIVAYRDKITHAHPEEIAFKKPEDLYRIRGIGSSMLSAMRPYLIFPGESRSTKLSSTKLSSTTPNTTPQPASKNINPQPGD